MIPTKQFQSLFVYAMFIGLVICSECT